MMTVTHTSSSSPAWHSGLAIAVDWTIGVFNALAGLILFSAAASNLLVYDLSLRIVALVVVFVVIGVTLLLLELFTLAGHVEQTASFMNSYFGRALLYLTMTILTSDSRKVNNLDYTSPYYLWLWANSLALAALTVAFALLSLISLFAVLPKPKSMDAKRAAGYDARPNADLEHGMDKGFDSFAFPPHRDETTNMIEGLSVSIPTLFEGTLAQDVYTTAPPRRPGRGHDSKWRTSTPPDHTSSWTHSTLHYPTPSDSLGSCNEKRQSIVLSQDGALSDSITSTPRFSRFSVDSANKLKQMPSYQTTTERLSNRSSIVGRSPPSQWVESLHESAAKDSSHHHELSYDEPSTNEAAAHPRQSRRLSHSDLPPLRMRSAEHLAPAVRKVVYVPSIAATVELSSGESSEDEEDDDEDANADDRSVYSLPSGVSPEGTYDNESPAQSVPDVSALGRRMTRKETRSIRKKIDRGIRRAASKREARPM